MGAYIYGQSGGSPINGVVESYKNLSAGAMSAGDFVQYVNGLADGANNQRGGAYDFVSTLYAAVALQDGKVLVLYSAYSTGYLTGIIVTVRGIAVTTSAPIVLTSEQTVRGAAAKIGDKILFAYGMSSMATYYVKALVLAVSGDTITAGSVTTIASGNTRANYQLSMAAANATTAVIAYNKDTSYYYLLANAVTISGMSVTAGGERQIGSTYQAKSLVTIAASDNCVVIVHCTGTGSALAAAVLTVNNGSIDTSVDTQIATTGGGYVSGAKISDNKVLVISFDNGYYLARVLTISGTAVTSGSAAQLFAGNSCIVSVAALADGRCACMWTPNSDNYLHGLILSVSGTTVTILTPDVALSDVIGHTNDVSPVVSTSTGILCANHIQQGSYYNLYLYAACTEAGIIPPSGVISGVTKTGGAAGAMLDVYVPET